MNSKQETVGRVCGRSLPNQGPSPLVMLLVLYCVGSPRWDRRSLRRQRWEDNRWGPLLAAEASDAMEVEKVAGTVDCSTQSDLREEPPRRLTSGMEWDA